MSDESSYSQDGFSVRFSSPLVLDDERPLTLADMQAAYAELSVSLARRFQPMQASSDESIRDLIRTQIKPGADPRARWDVDVYSHDPSADGPVFERQLPNGTCMRLETSGWFNTGPAVAPYVPHDVCRWRSTSHRAELERRARELAEATRPLLGDR